MTKPITSVAAMMLYEEGAFELEGPRCTASSRRSATCACTAAVRRAAPILEPAMEPVRMWHLLTHTSGLSYGFHYAHPVDAMYRAAGFEWGSPKGADLEACCDLWAALAPRVPARLRVELRRVHRRARPRRSRSRPGLPLDEFFRTRIFEPLGMNETVVVGERRRRRPTWRRSTSRAPDRKAVSGGAFGSPALARTDHARRWRRAGPSAPDYTVSP